MKTNLDLEPCLRQHSSHGVIRVVKLDELGVHSRTTYRRCQPGGPWTYLLPGIVLLSNSRPTARQRIEAALLHARGAGLLTGFEAARRFGLRNVPTGNEVHLLVPADCQFRSPGFVLIERTTHVPQRRDVGGVPTAPPARAILDGVRRLRDRDAVTALLIEARQSGLCSLAELSAELQTGSRRGTALPRAVLKSLADDLRSVAEAHAGKLWRRAGLPPPSRNPVLLHADGRYIATPDLWWDEVALAWEIDSFEHHFRRHDYAATLERNARYAGAGVILVQTVPSRLKRAPDAVINDLRAAYDIARTRPRPPLQTRRPPLV
ncbi:hypothetical protein [Amycolatopsis magusensis]|uniref:Transcriptional regulator, AbiEi antitoxin, Type IV TA system n=1 Tax=Amycolatopsis magusensis TaxID=882444 RepID=A0ABS4PN78_9PSEU|nr:hypothetical protein [Amycolatopsis magusensis]MBP2180793.1 hypothetical protein [Amycolatopsis magusensis]